MTASTFWQSAKLSHDGLQRQFRLAQELILNARQQCFRFGIRLGRSTGVSMLLSLIMKPFNLHLRHRETSHKLAMTLGDVIGHIIHGALTVLAP